MDKTVTVIGAGIVGVCCALHLQREGFKVRLIEKGEPGRAASFGNSGSFGIASCVPFGMPGVLKKVPRMLFDADLGCARAGTDAATTAVAAAAIAVAEAT